MALISNLLVRIGVDPDGVRRGVSRANNELSRFRDHASRIARDLGRSGEDGGRNFAASFASGIGRAAKTAMAGAATFLRAVAPVAAFGSAAIAAVPLVASLASTIASLTSAAIAASPALIAMGAGGFIVAKAFGAMFAEGTAARKALEPLGEMLTKATEAGSNAAAKGIRPLAQALREVAQPHVTRFMEGLGSAANRVQTEFLKWAKSSEGIRTLRDILEPLSAAVQGLAPHVTRVMISFAKMLGRIMGVSAAMGSRGLAGVLDWLSEKMDGVDASTVVNGLTRLASAGRTVMNVIRTVSGWIGKLVQAYKTYTAEFGLLADALSVAAIIFGGPLTAVIAAASLIVRHFDQIKAAWERLKAAFSGGDGGGPIGKAFADLRAAGATILPALKTAFEQIKTAVLPPLREIWTLIKNDLIPTFAEFGRAISPIVAWLIGVLGPVVAQTFANILNIIKGALNIIIGIVKVFIAILNGDWGKAWEGVKQILRGAMQIVVALIRQMINMIKGVLQLLWGIVRTVFSRAREIAESQARALVRGAASAIRGGVAAVKAALVAIKNAVTGVFRGAGSWLVSAGRAILDGLIRGIESAIGAVKSKLQGVTNLIPSWKGPMRVDLKLLEPTGRAIMSGLTSGISDAIPDVRHTLQGVTGDIPDFASPRGVTQSAQRAAPAEIVVKSGGSPLDDALVELLRAAIRDRGGNVQAVLGR